MKPRKLISSEQAVTGKVQHVTPCSDCPMSRDALAGWLGGATPDEYVRLAHDSAIVTRYRFIDHLML